ncbi:DUF5125 domain-containing protein [Marinilabiliaceae bacterium ANBcel2]|nr:DUF5125 domain-containing protein [Marinilabiliaceae bacterium ANBcel2]
MKKSIVYIGLSLFLFVLFSCDDNDDVVKGDPLLILQEEITSAHFGDSIPFTATVSDKEQVPLSTVKAKLFFGDEKVEETVIRTKNEGDYTGKIFVPFLKDIPDGTARLEFVLQNIEFAIDDEIFDVDITRASYPYLTLVSDEGEYVMENVEDHKYKAQDDFPQNLNAFIRTPVVNEWGNSIVFGWQNGEVLQGTENFIPFSSYAPGEYEVLFNTFTYEASPFITLEFAGKDMIMQDENNFYVETDIEQGDVIGVDGIANIEEWWIDEDFIAVNEDGDFVFKPISGEYRVTANFTHSYFRFEKMENGELATLNEDGSGALWIIGDGLGKPDRDNHVGWDTSKGLCMSQITPKVYQITLTAGSSLDHEYINFKFFHQRDWGGEFSNIELSTESDIIFVGDGDNDRDPGNLGLVDETPLNEGSKYRFEVDVTEGVDNAVLIVTEL